MKLIKNTHLLLTLDQTYLLLGVTILDNVDIYISQIWPSSKTYITSTYVNKEQSQKQYSYQ